MGCSTHTSAVCAPASKDLEPHSNSRLIRANVHRAYKRAPAQPSGDYVVLMKLPPRPLPPPNPVKVWSSSVIFNDNGRTGLTSLKASKSHGFTSMPHRQSCKQSTQ